MAQYYLSTKRADRFLGITAGKRFQIDGRIALFLLVSFLTCFHRSFYPAAFSMLFVFPIVSKYSVRFHSGLGDHDKLTLHPFPQYPVKIKHTSNPITSPVFVGDPCNMNQYLKRSRRLAMQ